MFSFDGLTVQSCRNGCSVSNGTGVQFRRNIHPDLPGCVATGKTCLEAEKNMHEAIAFHIEGLKEDRLPIPEGKSSASWVLV